MKIDRISYVEAFPESLRDITYVRERIGLEASLEDGEDIAECLKQLKETIASLHPEKLEDNKPIKRELKNAINVSYK